MIVSNTKMCVLCNAPLAVEPCTHIEFDDDQVVMTRRGWNELVLELGELRAFKRRIISVVQQ